MKSKVVGICVVLAGCGDATSAETTSAFDIEAMLSPSQKAQKRVRFVGVGTNNDESSDDSDVSDSDSSSGSSSESDDDDDVPDRPVTELATIIPETSLSGAVDTQYILVGALTNPIGTLPGLLTSGLMSNNTEIIIKFFANDDAPSVTSAEDFLAELTSFPLIDQIAPKVTRVIFDDQLLNEHVWMMLLRLPNLDGIIIKQCTFAELPSHAQRPPLGTWLRLKEAIVQGRPGTDGITDAHLRAFRGSVALERFDISDNAYPSAAAFMEVMPTLTSLSNVSIRNAQITDDHLRSFRGCPMLKDIDVVGNSRITAAAISEIMKSHGQLTLVSDLTMDVLLRSPNHRDRFEGRAGRSEQGAGSRIVPIPNSPYHGAAGAPPPSTAMPVRTAMNTSPGVGTARPVSQRGVAYPMPSLVQRGFGPGGGVTFADANMRTSPRHGLAVSGAHSPYSVASWTAPSTPYGGGAPSTTPSSPYGGGPFAMPSFPYGGVPFATPSSPYGGVTQFGSPPFASATLNTSPFPGGVSSNTHYGAISPSFSATPSTFVLSDGSPINGGRGMNTAFYGGGSGLYGVTEGAPREPRADTIIWLMSQPFFGPIPQ